MQTFIVLLRGINVSGQKKITMTDLRKMLEDDNFKAVETYIQSGNVVLKSNLDTNAKIAAKIKKSIANTFGFNVFVLVKKYDELKQIFENNPFITTEAIENKKVYFALLETAPQPELVAEFRKIDFTGEQFLLTDACVYLHYLNGAGKAKLTNNLIEKKLQLSATSRNYRTIAKLLEIAK